MRRPALALLAFLVATPAAAQGLFDDNEARRRIEVLRQQMTESNRQVDERLRKIEEAMGAASNRNAVLELASQLEALRSEIARMRGQVEVVTHQIDQAEQRQKNLYLDIDTRLRKLEQAEEARAAVAAAQPPGQGTAAQPAEPSPGELRAYQAALDQFKLGNYSLAVSAMQGFLVTYPGSALAPNAQYWIGMAHSGQRDYKSAIAAQRKVLADFPNSDKAPDAMLSIASAQETMGDRKAAQETLQELIQRYPSSSAAASAKQRIAAFSKR